MDPLEILVRVLLMMAISFGCGLWWSMEWLFDDRIPWPPSRLRAELLMLRTLLRIRRTSTATLSAMVEEARRQWPTGP